MHEIKKEPEEKQGNGGKRLLLPILRKKWRRFSHLCNTYYAAKGITKKYGPFPARAEHIYILLCINNLGLGP